MLSTYVMQPPVSPTPSAPSTATSEPVVVASPVTSPVTSAPGSLSQEDYAKVCICDVDIHLRDMSNVHIG